MKKVSDCCGVSPKNELDEDFSLCSKCLEYCEYITEEERELREIAHENLRDNEKEN